MSRNKLMTAALLAALLAAPPAAAQDAAQPTAEAGESGAGGSAPAQGEAAQSGTEAPPDAAPPHDQPVAPPPQPQARRYPRPRPPLPIMVVVLPGERVPEDVVAAARAALPAQIEPLASGRGVHGLAVAEMIAALSACTDDACIGGQLGSAGAQAGVLLRLTRRGRQLEASLEIRDPVSGTPRIEAIRGPIPSVAGEVPVALAALSARLVDAMPSPPPPSPSLLVTTTRDGALVTVDGEDIGESPVGAFEIADGDHEVLVRLAGYNAYRTQTHIAVGSRARVDATLASTQGGGAEGGDNPFTEQDQGEEDLLSTWWFWTIVGGGAAVVIAGVIIGLAVGLGDQGPPTPVMPNGIPLPPITGGM